MSFAVSIYITYHRLLERVLTPIAYNAPLATYLGIYWPLVGEHFDLGHHPRSVALFLVDALGPLPHHLGIEPTTVDAPNLHAGPCKPPR